jgi:hypothetical protein
MHVITVDPQPRATCYAWRLVCNADAVAAHMCYSWEIGKMERIYSGGNSCNGMLALANNNYNSFMTAWYACDTNLCNSPSSSFDSSSSSPTSFGRGSVKIIVAHFSLVVLFSAFTY